LNKIVHFEIDAEDLERVANFYKGVFDWEFTQWEGPMDYMMINTGTREDPGVGGAVMRRSEREQFKNHTINTIGVDSIDEVMDKIKKAGGRILAPKTAIPGVGYHCTSLDTEGNVFGVLQEDREAK